ncbi:ABC transporter G family member 22 [Halotydeus destructor]|nr:ABC transporter G family member 22 [Halotydeus destructor]
MDNLAYENTEPADLSNVDEGDNESFYSVDINEQDENAESPRKTHVKHTKNEPDLAIIWDKLSVYKVKSSKLKVGPLRLHERRAKIILNEVNGYFKLGQLAAIMGPSGSGKSTLLKALYGISTAHKTGSIWINHNHKRACFISQNEQDHLLETLTVEESLLYARMIKNKTNFFKSKTKRRDVDLDTTATYSNEDNKTSFSDVGQLIEKLGLELCRSTRVKKCSGGERKKLAIAQELVGDVKPDILFIDEPTSGLDSDASIKVIKQLRSFAIGDLEDRNSADGCHRMAIAVTIHQPSYRLLNLFNHLYVLTVVGKCIYSGPAGSVFKQHLVDFGLDCSDGHNPADVIVEAASVKPSQDLEDSDHSSDYNILTHSTSRLLRFLKGLISNSSSSGPPMRQESVYIDAVSELSDTAYFKIRRLQNTAYNANASVLANVEYQFMDKVDHLYASNIQWSFWQTWHLFWRALISGFARQKFELAMRVVPAMTMAFVIGRMYGPTVGQDDGCFQLYPIGIKLLTRNEMLDMIREETEVGKNASAIFFSNIFLIFIAMLPTILMFPKEITLFSCEKFNGWYNVRAYYWAKTLQEFTVLYLLVYVYTLYIYNATGQVGLYPSDGVSRFHVYVFVQALAAFAAQGVALVVGSMFPKSHVSAILFGVTVLLFNILFSGFFITFSKRTFMSYVQKLAFSKYTMETSLIALYGNRCNGTLLPGWFDHISVVMYKYDLSLSNVNTNVAALIVHLITYRVVTFYLLCRRAKCGLNETLSFNVGLLNRLGSLLFSLIVVLTLAAFLCLLLIH